MSLKYITTEMVEKDLTKEALAQLIDQMKGGYFSKKASAMLAEYLWNNGEIYSDEDIMEYVGRTHECNGIEDALYHMDLDEDPEGMTWDDLLDRDDVEYIDHSDPETQIIIFDV